MFTEEQNRIYNGLKVIGEEISNFYSDGVKLVYDDTTIASKANIIAHLAREIDGGLRDIFAPKLLKKEKEKEIKDIENAGHFASILVALGRDKNDKLANEWFDIATKFAHIAHRHGPWKETKESNEIILLWKRYERVLLTLAGSFYGIIDRLDHITEMVVPTPDILGFLSNILKIQKYEFHFFTKLKRVQWLSYLRSEGYFKAENAPKKNENNSYPNEWLPIRFLLNAAREKNKNCENEIIEVYLFLCNEYLANRIDFHPYSISILSEILIEFDSYSFSEIENKIFEKFLSSNPNKAWNLHESYLVEKLPAIYIAKENKKGIKNLLVYIFGINVYYEDNEELSKLGFAPYPTIRYLVDEYYLRMFVDQYSKGVIELLGIDGIRQVEEVIKKIVEINSFKFSSSAIPSIEHSEQSRYTNEWEANTITFILNGLNHLANEDLIIIISEYLTSEVKILRRIAFHIIREKYFVLKNIFFEFIATHALQASMPTHELYLLLKEKSSQFSDEEFWETIFWIESIEVNKYSDEETDEQLLKYRHYKIRKWLSSLNSTNNILQANLLNKRAYYDALDNTKIEHPEFDSYSKFSIGPEYPLTVVDFEEKDLDDQVEYINHFLPSEPHFSSDEGLSDILRQAFIRNPSKYLFNLDSFLKTESLYLYNLVDGFIEVMKEGQIADFNLLIEFIEKKVNDVSFESEVEKRFSYKKWFISRVGTFVEELSKKDELYDFTYADLIRISDLLINLLQRQEFKDCDEKITHDYVTHILNSTQGRLHMALVAVTNLLAEKTDSTSDTVKWPKNVKDYFSSRLYRNSYCDKDFSFILGYYFPNLLYFDNEWAVENLHNIFPKSNQIHFEYSLSCCLSIYSRQYKNVFEVLKQSALIKSALEIYNYDCGPLGSIMNYALLEYSVWKVKLDSKESTIRLILEKGQLAHIDKLIEMIGKSKLVMNIQLKELWDAILEVILSSPDKYKNTCRYLSWLIVCINELSDEYVQKLLLSINCFDENDKEGYSLIRRVYKLADTNLKNAGVLVFETFKKANLNSFSDRELYVLVEKLFKNNITKTANDICYFVGEKGQLSLKELYDKYNS